MSQGQSLDLSGERLSAESYGQMILWKSGAEFALFASLPARFTGADQSTIDAWSRFGSTYGCMVQIFTDIQSTFSPDGLNDLLKGKHSLPVIYTREQLQGEALADFERNLILSARGDRQALERAMTTMQACGAVRYSLERVELYRHRASAALPVILGDLGIDDPLRSIIRQFSVI